MLTSMPAWDILGLIFSCCWLPLEFSMLSTSKNEAWDVSNWAPNKWGTGLIPSGRFHVLNCSNASLGYFHHFLSANPSKELHFYSIHVWVFAKALPGRGDFKISIWSTFNSFLQACDTLRMRQCTHWCSLITTFAVAQKKHTSLMVSSVLFSLSFFSS